MSHDPTRSREQQDRLDEREARNSVYEIGFSYSRVVEFAGLTLTALASIDCERVGDSVEVIAYSLDGLERDGLTLDFAEFKRAYPFQFERINDETRKYGEDLANTTPVERWKYSGQTEGDES